MAPGIAMQGASGLPLAALLCLFRQAASLHASHRHAKVPFFNMSRVRYGDQLASVGCTSGISPKGSGKVSTFHMLWSEEKLPPVNRTFNVFVPSTYEPGSPSNLLMVFHGWGEDASYHADYGFRRYATRHKTIMVYPIGMDDCHTKDCQGGSYTSWNGVGTTDSSESRRACVPSKQPYDFCYDSCRIKYGRCNPCSWTTCYNDVDFISTLLGHMKSNYCIDLTRVFALGCSNGGMFVHELAQHLPGRFAGIVANCGGKPHLGWEHDLPASGPPISVAAIVGNQDHTIPENGTRKTNTEPWFQGWLYANFSSTLDEYKRYNGCQNEKPIRYGAGFNKGDMKCWKWGYNCKGNSVVARCRFQGNHDFNLAPGTNQTLEELNFAWMFFNQHWLHPKYVRV